jgi:hypothetical protein
MAQNSIYWESGIRQNPQFTDRSGSGNPGHRINCLDVLCDGEEPSHEQEQVGKHIMMVGSWLSMVSSEVHING